MTDIEKIRQGLKDQQRAAHSPNPQEAPAVSMNAGGANANDKADFSAFSPIQKIRAGLLMANGLNAAEAKVNVLGSGLGGEYGPPR